MKRVRIAGPVSLYNEIIGVILSMDVFHAAAPSTDPGLGRKSLQTGSLGDNEAKTLARAESLVKDISLSINLLPDATHPLSGADSVFSHGVNWLEDWALARFEAIAGEALSISSHIGRLQAELKAVETYREIFEEFSPLIEMVSTSHDTELIGVVFPGDITGAIDNLESALEKVTGGACSVFRPAANELGQAALIVIPASLEKAVMQSVFEKKVNTISFPEKYREKTFALTMKKLYESQKQIESELLRLKIQEQGFSEKWISDLKIAHEGIRRAIEPVKAENYLLYSDSVFWITGWAPAEESAGLVDELNRRFDYSVITQLSDPKPDEYDSIPVALRNPRWAKSFERFINLYSLPVYGTIDPTTITAVTLPLFFGMILGDIGYGATLAVGAWCVRKRWGESGLVRDISRILFVLAGSSVVFGLVYGELFGKLWASAGFPDPLFDRKHKTTDMLSIVISIGFFHVAFGSILGAVNSFNVRSFRTTVTKLADATISLSIFWIAVTTSTGGSAAFWFIIPVSAFIIKGIVGKFIETVMEIPKLVSNVLSYARLMALGLASITLADLADDVAFSPGPAPICVMAAVAVHTLNFALGVLSPAIQSGRLHYVEFFGQFYAPGGTAYAPLGYK